MRRSISAILAVLTVVNGFLMLVAGPFWYASVPGASETGPYNPHFVQDIGAAFLVAVDIRPDSPTLGRWVGKTITAENRLQMWAPPGCARGLCALTDKTRVQYLCTGMYNGKAESGVLWNDTEIGIQWPVAKPRLSAKDQTAQTLREWLGRPESKSFSLARAV